MEGFMKNWKTSACGVLMFVTSLSNALIALWDTSPATSPDWNTVVLAAITAIGLLCAKDANK
jgi:hypothetical protein